MAFIDAGSAAAANGFACAAEAGFGPAYYTGLFANPILDWSDDQLFALAGAGRAATPTAGRFSDLRDGAAHAGWVDSINAAADAARRHGHADRAGRRRWPVDLTPSLTPQTTCGGR